MTWRIRNWDTTFENSQSRKYDNLRWVPIPNRHDTDGYTMLMDDDHGVMHYGAWIALVQLASRCKPRGTLIRSDGRPHDYSSVARITRIGSQVFREAIPRFLSDEIGWLDDVQITKTPNLNTNWERTGSVLVAEPNRIEPNRIIPAVGPAAVSFSDGWDSEAWQQALPLYELARERLLSTGVRPKPRDRDTISKAALVAVLVYDNQWFTDALSGLDEPAIKNRIAVWKSRLTERPKAEGRDLRALMDAMTVPMPEKPT